MKVHVWSILERTIRSRNYSLANCHAIGTCVRFLSSRVRGVYPKGLREVLKEVRARFRDVRGLTSTLLRDCVSLSVLLRRPQANRCTTLTISHFRELRGVTSPGAARKLLLDAESRVLTCRELRKEAVAKQLELSGRLSPEQAAFVAATEAARHQIAASRHGLFETHVYTSQMPTDRDYLESKVADWHERLIAIEHEIVELTQEMCVAPPLPITEADAA